MATKPKQRPDDDTTSRLSLKRQLVFWLIALAVFALFLWLFIDMLLPFIAAMALAYLLDPLVLRMQKLGVNRTIAALLIVAVAIAMIVLALTLLVPVIADQVGGLVAKLPEYFEKFRDWVARTNQGWLGQMVSERLPEAEKSLSGMAAQAAGWLATFVGSIWAGGKALVSVISLLVITPVVTFYLLLDWDRMLEKIDSWIPRPHRETVRQLLREVDDAIAGFMRGQALCCLFLGTFYCVGLSLVGLNFALLIGLVAGIFSFIPYLGAMTGLLLAGSVAIAQFWPDWIPIAMTLGVFAVGQALEGNVLQPYLVGAKIGLHPVWLMFALLAFGYVFGFVGLLIAVPVAASIGVLVRFLLRQYLASPYYTGG